MLAAELHKGPIAIVFFWLKTSFELYWFKFSNFAMHLKYNLTLSSYEYFNTKSIWVQRKYQMHLLCLLRKNWYLFYGMWTLNNSVVPITWRYSTMAIIIKYYVHMNIFRKGLVNAIIFGFVSESGCTVTRET